MRSSGRWGAGPCPHSPLHAQGQRCSRQTRARGKGSQGGGGRGERCLPLAPVQHHSRSLHTPQHTARQARRDASRLMPSPLAGAPLMYLPQAIRLSVGSLGSHSARNGVRYLRSSQVQSGTVRYLRPQGPSLGCHGWPQSKPQQARAWQAWQVSWQRRWPCLLKSWLCTISLSGGWLQRVSRSQTRRRLSWQVVRTCGGRAAAGGNLRGRLAGQAALAAGAG
jgi:hypothetical protein